MQWVPMLCVHAMHGSVIRTADAKGGLIYWRIQWSAAPKTSGNIARDWLLDLASASVRAGLFIGALA
jgi:hypothetical protein